MPSYHHGGPIMAESNPGLHGGQYPVGIPVSHGDAALAGLVGSMNGMGLAGSGIPHGGYPGAMPSGYHLFPQEYIMTQVPGQQPMAMMENPYGAPTYIPAHHANQYPHHMVQYQPQVLPPYTPRRPVGTQNRSDRGQGEALPPLDSGRRDSSSTNESTPTTPYDRGTAHRGNSLPVSIIGVDHSAYTTPSPQQAGMPAINGDHGITAKQIHTALDRSIEALLKLSPPIPTAVPAVFTPSNQIKTLEQSLENRISGNRNVYIRGLHPTTDDELLLRYSNRFGSVETSKAILDTATGACKGYVFPEPPMQFGCPATNDLLSFGFAKFRDVRDSEKCIRGFHSLGYEVGFARVSFAHPFVEAHVRTRSTDAAWQESFNSRLKAEGDESSTNLYISNLPKHMNEMVSARHVPWRYGGDTRTGHA